MDASSAAGTWKPEIAEMRIKMLEAAFGLPQNGQLDNELLDMSYRTEQLLKSKGIEAMGIRYNNKTGELYSGDEQFFAALTPAVVKEVNGHKSR